MHSRAKYEVDNAEVESWMDGSGHEYVSLTIRGIQAEEGRHGLTDGVHTIKPIEAIALGKAIQKAGLKGLKKR